MDIDQSYYHENHMQTHKWESSLVAEETGLSLSLSETSAPIMWQTKINKHNFLAYTLIFQQFIRCHIETIHTFIYSKISS